MKKNNHIPELVEFAIDRIKEMPDGKIYGCDLHHEIFNTDYYIIGYYQAEQWLIKNPGIFNAIEEIKDYEKFNFGEVNTDFSSSEAVVNMYVYIKGEEILQESETLREKWDVRLEKEDLDNICEELEQLIK